MSFYYRVKREIDSNHIPTSVNPRADNRAMTYLHQPSPLFNEQFTTQTLTNYRLPFAQNLTLLELV